MKHTLEELQFAATVRALAIARRNSQITDEMSDSDVRAVKAGPYGAFIPAVISDLEAAADLIEQARSVG